MSFCSFSLPYMWSISLYTHICVFFSLPLLIMLHNTWSRLPLIECFMKKYIYNHMTPLAYILPSSSTDCRRKSKPFTVKHRVLHYLTSVDVPTLSLSVICLLPVNSHQVWTLLSSLHLSSSFPLCAHLIFSSVPSTALQTSVFTLCPAPFRGVLPVFPKHRTPATPQPPSLGVF